MNVSAFTNGERQALARASAIVPATNQADASWPR
jgi:hypothetical protein